MKNQNYFLVRTLIATVAMGCLFGVATSGNADTDGTTGGRMQKQWAKHGTPPGFVSGAGKT